jgi:hypothetical protein
MPYQTLGWILPVVAVAGGITWLTLSSYWKSKSRTGDPASNKALEDNTAVNKALLEKLTSIDDRLTAVEKTLNDIPN